MAARPIKWLPNFLGGRPQVGGVNVALVTDRQKYSETLTSTGSGIVVVTHTFGTTDVIADIQRILVVNSVPIGSVAVRWWPSSVNAISIDFDTYVRVASEFRVTVMA